MKTQMWNQPFLNSSLTNKILKSWPNGDASGRKKILKYELAYKHAIGLDGQKESQVLILASAVTQVAKKAATARTAIQCLK